MNPTETTVTRSAEFQNFAKALLKFKAEIGPIFKDAVNPHFRSKYASLPSIIDVIDGPLCEAGLAYIQIPLGEGKLYTLVTHAESGEFIEATCSLMLDKPTPQALGSAITYMRRYSLQTIFGLKVEDDDGQRAEQHSRTTQKMQPPQPRNHATEAAKKAYAQARDHAASGANSESERVSVVAAFPSAVESLLRESLNLEDASLKDITAKEPAKAAGLMSELLNREPAELAQWALSHSADYDWEREQ